MPNAQEIAVKELSLESSQGLREFTTEVKLLMRTQHPNLVTLLGCCAEGPKKMLVYEFLPNQSLDYFLFGKNSDTVRAFYLFWQMTCIYFQLRYLGKLKGAGFCLSMCLMYGE